MGFNVAFFPMHLMGLWGMPRRIYTYPAELGWQTLNLISTAGAFLLAAGILVFLLDVVRNLRPTLTNPAGNVWNAGTLEWLASGIYGLRSIPHVSSRDPLWDRPELQRQVTDGRFYLPDAPTGSRETIVTSPIQASPQYLLRLPGPAWSSFLAAVLTAAFFMLLTVKLVVPAAVCGTLAVASILVWMWDSDPEPRPPVHIGGGIKLATYVSGPDSHAWWATAVLLMVAGSLYLAFVFSYLYLWTVAPQAWPPSSGQSLPAPGWALASGALALVSTVAMLAAARVLGASPATRHRGRFYLLVSIAVAAISASLASDVAAHWQSGLRPDASGYAAMVYLAALLQLQIVAALVIMAAHALARHIAGRLDGLRRVTFDNLALLWHYAVAQALLGLLLVHGFPRVAG